MEEKTEAERSKSVSKSERKRIGLERRAARATERIVEVDTVSGRPLRPIQPVAEVESEIMDEQTSGQFEIGGSEVEGEEEEEEVGEAETEVDVDDVWLQEDEGLILQEGELDTELPLPVSEVEELPLSVEKVESGKMPFPVEELSLPAEEVEELSFPVEETEDSEDNVDNSEDDLSSAALPLEEEFREVFIVPSGGDDELKEHEEEDIFEPEAGDVKEKQDDEEAEVLDRNEDDDHQEPVDEIQSVPDEKADRAPNADEDNEFQSERDVIESGREPEVSSERDVIESGREPEVSSDRECVEDQRETEVVEAEESEKVELQREGNSPDFSVQGDMEKILQPQIRHDIKFQMESTADEENPTGTSFSPSKDRVISPQDEPFDFLLDTTGGRAPSGSPREEQEGEQSKSPFTEFGVSEITLQEDEANKTRSTKNEPEVEETGAVYSRPVGDEISVSVDPIPRWTAPLSLTIDAAVTDSAESGSCKSPRLEETVRGEDAGPSSRSVSAQIRQIVTKHLSTEDLTEVGASKHDVRLLQDENRELQRELERLEDLLAATRAEREAVLIKYNALGDRMDQFLRQRDAADGTFMEEEAAFKNVLAQNLELRRRIEEQQANFQKKLRTYSDGQSQQTQLVQRLQTKVIQYRQKCDDLESGDRTRQLLHDQSRLRTSDVTFDLGGGGNLTDDDAEQSYRVDSDFDPTVIRLEQEQSRCANLIHVNTLLREQLEAATQANQSLAVDVQKVTQDWSSMREELASKEAEWRDEEQSFNDYFMDEHNRLMSLWRDAVKFRREFGDMKSSTEQDLGKIRNEFNQMANELRKACQAAHSQTDARSRHADESDVNVVIGSYEGAFGDGVDTVSPTELWRRIQDLGKAQMEALAERSEMLARIEDLKSLNDQLRISLDDKERAINSMSTNLQEMESTHSVAQNASTLLEERDVLFSTLRDFASQLTGSGQVRDDDERDAGPSMLVPDISGLSDLITSRGAGLGGSALASTLATIQSALNQRQVQIEDLTKKLSLSRDQLNTFRKQFEDCTEHKRHSEQQIQQLKSQLESCHRDKSDLGRDLERLKLKFNGLADEKGQLDNIRLNSVNDIARLNSENDQLRRELAETDNTRQVLDEEKEIFLLEKEKQHREIDICQKTISTLELRLTSLKEELIHCKETLNKTGLKKDIIKQEKAETEEALKLVEKRCRSLELESAKLKSSESNLRDLLSKLHGDSEALGQERAELTNYSKKLSEDKVTLSGEIAEMEQEKTSLKEELLRLEQEKISLVEDREAVREALAFAESTNVSLQGEADRHAREKRELGSQLTTEIRKNSSLAEDIVHLTREMEHSRHNLNSTIKERELIAKERADALVRLETVEREARSLAETLATLKVEKSNLEMSLYESQQEIASLDARRSQLELERNDLIEKRQTQQSLIGQLQKDLEAEKYQKDNMKSSFEKRLLQAGKDQSASLERHRQQHQEISEKFIKEKETLKLRLETSHAEVIQRISAERNQSNAKQQAKLDAMRRDLEAHQRDSQEQFVNGEREKERLKEMYRNEKSKFMDQIQTLQKELQSMQSNAEREKREISSRSDQEKAVIVDLQAQLRTLRIQLEDTDMTHEKVVKDLRNQIQEIQHQKNTAQQEIVTVSGKLQIAEDGKEHLRKELAETMRKLKHGGDQTTTLQKEVSEVRREVSDARHESSVLQKSNEEYCTNLKKIESEKFELKRHLEECQQKNSVMDTLGMTSTKEIEKLRSTLQEVERSRLDYRKESYTLRKDLKNLEESLLQKTQEVADLQVRVGREEDKDDFNKREILALKQKLTDTESNRESLRKDLANLQRKLSETVDVGSLKERELRTALELSRQCERQLDDRKRQLEMMFTTATSQCDDFKLKLSISEGKIGALESQLLKLEASKKNVEQKLTSVYSSLRRYVGVHLDNGDAGGRVSFRSPVRRLSPMRGAEGDVTVPGIGEPRRRFTFLDRIQSVADVDPDLIRASLRDVMQQLTSLEKEKEETNVLVKQMKEQLSDSQSERLQMQDRLNHLQNSLGSTSQDNQKTMSQLASSQQNVLAQQEAIARLQKENNVASETVDNLQHRIKQLEGEKSENLTKLTKFNKNETRLEMDLATLRANLTETENRISKSDQTKRNQETELQRLRMSLTDKDTERQVLQDRCETMNRHVQELEDKCASLQLTVDRLNLSLERSASDESELKGKLQNLNRSLTESTSSGYTLQDNIQNLQRSLANCENERRATQERLESTKQSLNESKKSNLVLAERVQQLRQEVSNAEDRNKDLEREMKSSEKLIGHHRDGDQDNLLQIQRLQQEKQSLQSTVAELQRTLTQLEMEKHDFQRWHVLLEKDKSALKQHLDKVERERLMTSELASRTNRERSYLDNSLTSLDKENKDLQLRLQALEVQTAERERFHSQQLLNLTTRHRQEKDIEIERLRNAKVQAEKTLELRERAHRQRVLGLEQQIQMLRDQLNQEIRKRQMYIQKSTQSGEDMKDLREALDKSLKNVSHDSSLNTLLLERETRVLDSALDRHLSDRLSPAYRERSRTLSPRRSVAATTSTPIPRSSLRLPFTRHDKNKSSISDSFKRM